MLEHLLLNNVSWCVPFAGILECSPLIFKRRCCRAFTNRRSSVGYCYIWNFSAFGISCVVVQKTLNFCVADIWSSINSCYILVAVVLEPEIIFGVCDTQIDLWFTLDLGCQLDLTRSCSTQKEITNVFLVSWLVNLSSVHCLWLDDWRWLLKDWGGSAQDLLFWLPKITHSFL